MRIISIIVTHNRLKELKNCLQYIDKQIKKPDKILVVNNNSSDGTEDFLIFNNIDHINSIKNIGSAGGWNIGIEYALNNHFDLIWLMDDDGYPHHKSLSYLYDSILDKDIVCLSSLVVDSKNHTRLAIPLPVLNKKKLPVMLKKKRKIYFTDDLLIKNNKFYEFANFFNGTLIKVNAIKSIGQINKNFFLYGEEVDYFFRLRQLGSVYTLCKAIHYHPSINKPWTLIKIYFYIKNSIYLNYQYFDYPLLRSYANLIVILFRVIKNNNISFFINLFKFVNFKIIILAVIRGFSFKLGNDFKK